MEKEEEDFFFGTNPSSCWYLDNRAAKDAYQWFLAYAERHVPKRRKGLNKSLECDLRQKRFWVPILRANPSRVSIIKGEEAII